MKNAIVSALTLVAALSIATGIKAEQTHEVCITIDGQQFCTDDVYDSATNLDGVKDELGLGEKAARQGTWNPDEAPKDTTGETAGNRSLGNKADFEPADGDDYPECMDAPTGCGGGSR